MSPYSIWYHRLCGAAGALLLVAVVAFFSAAPLPLVGFVLVVAGMFRAWASLVVWSGLHALLPTRRPGIEPWTPPVPPPPTAHPSTCGCWRCRETRGEEDTLRPFRARDRDPLTCAHLAGDAMPLSGDGWICGVCGDDIPEPKGAHQ